jgi:hypothetical protein
MRYTFEDGQPPLIITLQKMYQKQPEWTDGISFKRTFDPSRDVDYLSCFKLLLKFNADPFQPSINNTMPIFKAIKAGVSALTMLLEFTPDRPKAINVLDNKGMTPLCKLAEKPETDETFKMITLLLKFGATCLKSIPDYHPMYLALESKNCRVVRALFKHSDAVDVLA